MNNSLIDELLNVASTTAHSNLTVPTLLVDCSYLTYYSMFSAWKTFSEQYSDLCPSTPDYTFDPAIHNEYLSLLRERFSRALMSGPLKVYPFIEPHNIIFARDCQKSKIWRIDQYKEYKQERRDAKDSDKNFAFSGTFKFIYDVLIPEYEEEGSICLSVPCSEGDDIIATLIKNKIANNFIILASDRDLLQLVNDKVVMINVAGENITFSKELEIPDEELNNIGFGGKEYIFIKALMGDKSDGIASIHARCGKKTAIKYFFNKNLLQEKMISEPGIKNIIKNNISIMDFDYIPKEINDAIMKAYNQAKLK